MTAMSRVSAFADFAASQTLLVGVVLALAGISKFSKQGMVAAEGTGLARLIRRRSMLRRTWKAIGVVESVTGLALLMDGQPIATLFAAGLLVSTLVYTSWAWMVHPTSSCGCFGAHSAAPVSRESVLRTGLICAFALVAVFGRGSWWDVPSWAWPVLAVEAVVVLALSPERHLVRRRGAIALSKLCRACLPLAPNGPIMHSRAWKRLSDARPESQPELIDSWHVGCWRFLAFSLTGAESGPTAVFAIPPLWPLRRIRGSIADVGERRVVRVLA